MYGDRVLTYLLDNCAVFLKISMYKDDYLQLNGIPINDIYSNVKRPKKYNENGTLN